MKFANQEYLATVVIVATLMKDLGYIQEALEVLDNACLEIKEMGSLNDEAHLYLKYLNQRSNCLELLGRQKEALDIRKEIAKLQPNSSKADRVASTDCPAVLGG